MLKAKLEDVYRVEGICLGSIVSLLAVLIFKGPPTLIFPLAMVVIFYLLVLWRRPVILRIINEEAA